MAYCGYQVWTSVSHSITERLSMIASGGTSGRDSVWMDGFYYLKQQDLWYGMGGIVQGFFVQRADLLESPEMRWGSTLNMYIDAIMETGLIGLVLWGGILMCFFSKAIFLLKTKRTVFKFIPLAMAMFGLLQGIGESMPVNPEHPAGMMMLLGLVIVSARRFEWGDGRYDYKYHRQFVNDYRTGMI